MKTIVKAVTKRLAVDGWERKYDSDFDMVVGETYLCHNKKIKHMLISQSVIEDSREVFPLGKHFLLDKDDQTLLQCT